MIVYNLHNHKIIADQTALGEEGLYIEMAGFVYIHIVGTLTGYLEKLNRHSHMFFKDTHPWV